MEKTAFNFEDWFDNFWSEIYPSDLCHGKRGDKTKGKNAAIKVVKNESDANRIISNTREWIKYSKAEKNKTGYTDRWPMISTFFNQAVYDREIPSYSELSGKPKERKKLSQCCFDGCKREKHGPKFDCCHIHLNHKRS